MTSNEILMAWSLIVACNWDAVLQNNLLKSKDVEQADRIVVQRGAINAAEAYNAGIKSCKSDLMVFAHQDVYLPGGWADRMQRCIASLTEIDPYWGGLTYIFETNGGIVCL
ncbi:MAG: glycosyltransferase family 2 protein [Thermoproteota archaeon]